ncbi:MAG TPA: GNAT family N-acetyltransferase [Luteibaculaceae bacterium]|nr:GNAT family N-acetyltransferase [Luteibaculaceae bacterium]
MIRIEDYQPQWAPDFYRLNTAWLKAYFYVEPIDEQVLGQPEAFILRDGGSIWFLLKDDRVVGTAAFRRLPSGEVELTKMAVDESQRGLGYGALLLEEGLKRAQNMGLQELTLYSSTVLKNAIHLYRKYGFVEVDLEAGVYGRADIKMRKYFTAHLSENRRRELIESYRTAASRLIHTVRNMPEEALVWRSSELAWSIQDIAQHLVDSEMHGYLRLRFALAEPGYTISPYDQDRWVALGSPAAVDANLRLFDELRQRNAQVLESLHPSQWENTWTHPDRGVLTVDQWLMNYESHTHLGQINRIFTAWKKQTGQA